MIYIHLSFFVFPRDCIFEIHEIHGTGNSGIFNTAILRRREFETNDWKEESVAKNLAAEQEHVCSMFRYLCFYKYKTDKNTIIKNAHHDSKKK